MDFMQSALESLAMEQKNPWECIAPGPLPGSYTIGLDRRERDLLLAGYYPVVRVLYDNLADPEIEHFRDSPDVDHPNYRLPPIVIGMARDAGEAERLLGVAPVVVVRDFVWLIFEAAEGEYHRLNLTFLGLEPAE